MSSEPATIHATVSGRVQGVGFRQFVQRTARSYSLRGWVRNRPDGKTVELMAKGSRQQIDAFVEEIRAGPSGAHVDNIDVAWSEASDLPATFEIRA